MSDLGNIGETKVWIETNRIFMVSCAIDFHRIICKIEQHVRRVSTDVIAYPQSVAIDSSPGVGFVFSDLYDVFFRELIVSIFNRHLFSMLCH